MRLLLIKIKIIRIYLININNLSLNLLLKNSFRIYFQIIQQKIKYNRILKYNRNIFQLKFHILLMEENIQKHRKPKIKDLELI